MNSKAACRLTRRMGSQWIVQRSITMVIVFVPFPWVCSLSKWPSLPKTNSSHLKIGFPQKDVHLSAIHFLGRNVSFREGKWGVIRSPRNQVLGAHPPSIRYPKKLISWERWLLFFSKKCPQTLVNKVANEGEWGSDLNKKQSFTLRSK